MRYYHWDELESVALSGDSLRKFVAGEQVSIVRTETSKGTCMPDRCFPHEAFIVVLEGAWRVRVNGHDVVVGSNQLLHLPPYARHDVESLERTLALEILPEPNASSVALSEVEPIMEDENYLWGV
ncbi:MAG: hypothetical protein D6723_19255 [Acidobacteria bacterium]|nr:MAG: hypothetical protein D6723_19255 [Acidobacteriota bacterium]